MFDVQECYDDSRCLFLVIVSSLRHNDSINYTLQGFGMTSPYPDHQDGNFIKTPGPDNKNQLMHRPQSLPNSGGPSHHTGAPFYSPLQRQSDPMNPSMMGSFPNEVRTKIDDLKIFHCSLQSALKVILSDRYRITFLQYT